MDDLRLALLIAGLVVVAGIYAFARVSRRRAARKAERPDLGAPASRDEHGSDPDDGGALDAGSMDDATGTRRAFRESGTGRAFEDSGTEADIGRLGGIFAATRETSDAELSIDVSILEGLRATYESTMDGTLDGTVEEALAFAPSEDSGAMEPAADTGGAPPPADAVAARPAVDAVAAPRSADGASAPPVSVDMTRPLVYLTLVGKQERVSGRVVLDSLDEEGFRPGLMKLYYWRTDAEPSVVFGVANMVEPGVLDPDALPRMETPGLVTFMSVPQDSASAFRILDTMVAVSRRLARRIDATVCDETRSTLTAQAENHLREKIADILRQDRIRD